MCTMNWYRKIIKAVIMLATLFTIEAKNHCNACFDGGCYTRVPIFNKHRLSGQIAIDRIRNIIYFHYEDSQSVDHTVGFDLDDIRLKIIPNISFSFARTVDQTTGILYIGGAHGIFKFNTTANKITNYGLSDKTIWHLQYNNRIFYTVFMKKGLYVYQNNQSISVRPLSNYSIDDFVVDRNSDVYFVSDSKVYRLKNGTSHVDLFLDDIYSLSMDSYDNLYFVQPSTRGLYKFNSKNDKLVEIGAFDTGNPVKFVFDSNNNVVYYDKYREKLFYLTPNFGRCKVTRSWNKGFKKRLAANKLGVKLRVHRI